MSFSSNVKAELCKDSLSKKSCAVAEGYGVLLYCNTFSSTEIRIIQAAGVSTGSDVYHVIIQGADGSGGTSGILNAPSRKGKIIEMLDALVKAKKDLV